MKKLIVLFAFTTIFISCGKDTEEFLYNKYDEDYGRVQAMATKKCESETPIFAELQKTNLFDTFFTDTKKTRLIKYSRKSKDGANTPTIITSVVIKRNEEDPTATMEVFVSSNAKLKDEEQHYKFTYTRKDNSNLLATIVTGVCSSDKKLGAPVFEPSWMRFTSARESILDVNNFTKKSETVTVQIGLPIVLSKFSQAEAFESKEKLPDGTITTVEWSYETAATSTEGLCADNQLECDGIESRANAQSCVLKVNTDFTRFSSPNIKLSEIDCSKE